MTDNFFFFKKNDKITEVSAILDLNMYLVVIS